ncbi:MAG: hypothetical protein OES24_11735 [Acidimicrobiia bacterium]|nr:hypothetical protein [Acidimicrobiia bacterium]
MTAVLLIVPLTLLGACAGQGGDNGDNSDSADGDSADGDSADDQDPTPTEVSTPASATESETPTAEPLTAEGLLGEWAKVDDGDPACADYPDQLTFESFGYLTSLHDDRAPVLDGGSWEIDGDRLLLSNPIDAMVSYPVTLTDDGLELDTGTCTVRYRRLGESDRG